MPKLNANAAMLWSMAASITLSLLLTRYLQAEGLHPIHAALIQACGCFLVVALFDRPSLRPLLRRDALTYFAIASLIGFTIPRLVVATAVTHTGVGLTTLAFTLPLVVTYGIAIAIRVESFDRMRFAFLTITLLGALIYVSTRLEAVSVELGWVAILLMAPLTLGIANVYRSMAWPADLPPTAVALATALFSLISYMGILVLNPVSTPLLLFMLAAGFEQRLIFKLQRSAGPVYIGQAGALVVLFGGIMGYLLFDETYTVITFAGSILILVGVITYGRYCGRDLAL